MRFRRGVVRESWVGRVSFLGGLVFVIVLRSNRVGRRLVGLNFRFL